MSTPGQQPIGEVIAREAARAAVWGLLLIILLVFARYMVIQPYATKFNKMMGAVVLATTGLEVGNFTSLSPDQATLIRSKLKFTAKKAIDFGLDEWQSRLRQVASDPQLKQDFKEAVELTAVTWHREARRQ